MVKSKFIVPNLFTSMNFLLGVWAIVIASGVLNVENPILTSAHLIVLCVLLDKLDGFAAKVMGAFSEFGAQFDSLADLIAFGLAPAFLLLHVMKSHAPIWYDKHSFIVFIAFSLYVLCAAMRLAKYNAVDADSHPDYFVGMPSTLAGAFMSLFIVLCVKYGFITDENDKLMIMPMTLIACGVLMISPLFLSKLKRRKNKLLNFAQLFCYFNSVYLWICHVVS